MKLRNRWPELTIVAGIFLFALWYCAAFVFPNHPRRPKNVPASASLVLSGGHAFWQYCWLDTSIQKDRCQIFYAGGGTIICDIFLPYPGTEPVPKSRLKIDTSEKYDTGDGDSYVRLQDGTILIPQKWYAEGKRRIDQLRQLRKIRAQNGLETP